MTYFDLSTFTNATLIAPIIASGRCRVGGQRHQMTDLTSNVSMMTSSQSADRFVGELSTTGVNDSDVILDNGCDYELIHDGSELGVTVPTGYGRPRKEDGHQASARQLIVSVTLVVYTTVFAFGFLGNTLVILVIVK
jgi:hypothetical protein